MTETSSPTPAPPPKPFKRQTTFGSLRRKSLIVSDAHNVKLLRSATLTEHPDEQTALLGSAQPKPTPSSLFQNTTAFVKSTEFRKVLKCSGAYFLASLLVYTPLRTWFGTGENKHMAATVAVYFHPARTLGSMIESCLFVLLALTYSGLMTVGSMLVSRLCIRLDQRVVGYAIDLFVFCAMGLGTIAWMKQRVNKPTFNTACSVASIFLITTLVKEGSIQVGAVDFRRMQASFALVWTGIFISAAVCVAVWRESAVSNVKKQLNKSMDLNAEMLELLTDKFVNMESIHTSKYFDLKNQSSKCFKSLEKEMADATYELGLQGKQAELAILSELAKGSYQMLLHVNGLGSAAITQYSLIQSDLEPPEDDDFFNPSSYGTLENSSAIVTDTPCRNLFTAFLKSLGPPMRQYTTALNGVLSYLPFRDTDHSVNLDPKYIPTISTATDVYSKQREKAIETIYNDLGTDDLSADAQADQEGSAASCGNFSYLLEELGNELIAFMKTVDRYERELALPSPRTYSWINVWSWRRLFSTKKSSPPPTKFEPFAPQPPREATWGLRVWRSLTAFRRPAVQFGFKVGLGAALFAVPAYTARWREPFTQWRGEWGLVTFCVIMNKSVGGTLSSVPIRILGTFLGAVGGWAIWTLVGENAVVLPLIGWAVATGCFWIILQWPAKNMFGRFILLTLNLTLLYTYSLSVADQDDADEDDDETQLIVMDIAFHRFVSVCVGVLWALLVSTLVLPNSARARLKRGLSALWVRMGLVWRADFLQTVPRKSEAGGGGGNVLSGPQSETEMARAMLDLQELLASAPNELRLKGAFPTAQYTALLAATQRVLDAFQDLRVLIAKDPKPSSQELRLLELTRPERRELCNRVFLGFYLLGSALRLGVPVPGKMPAVDGAVERMLVKLNAHRQEVLAERASKGSDGKGDDDYGYEEDFVLFYSYVLVSIAIAEQVADMALIVMDLFGVIEDDTFDV